VTANTTPHSPEGKFVKLAGYLTNSAISSSYKASGMSGFGGRPGLEAFQGRGFWFDVVVTSRDMEFPGKDQKLKAPPFNNRKAGPAKFDYKARATRPVSIQSGANGQRKIGSFSSKLCSKGTIPRTLSNAE
jgi:hypothetical protein